MSDMMNNLKKVYSDTITEAGSSKKKTKSLFRKIRRRVNKDSPVTITTLKPKLPNQ
jgi:hypothetical protein